MNIIKALLLLYNKTLLIICTFFCVLNLYGCDILTHPSYPKEHFTERIEETAKKEYNMDIKALVNGKTLGVYLPLETLLNDKNDFDKDALTKIENSIQCIHRAVLSTDQKMDFYTLTAVDITTIGIEFTITGNIDDIKKVRFQQIGRDEYFKRIMRDINVSISHIGDKEGTSFVVWDISLNDFLAKQICKRIQGDLPETKGFTESLKIESLEAALNTSVDGVRDFFFKVKINPLSENADYEKLFLNPAKKIISSVLKSYSFKDFDVVSIYNLSNNLQNQWTKTEILGKLK